MVRFNDGSVLGQLGWPDMRLPIAYALLYPERKQNTLRPWNPVETPNLSFESVDHETFPCLGLAKESVRIGGTMPCVMNAANEIAANAFLKGELSFLGISDVVQLTMREHDSGSPTLENIRAADDTARAFALKLIHNL